jgi:hypothetical protein
VAAEGRVPLLDLAAEQLLEKHLLRRSSGIRRFSGAAVGVLSEAPLSSTAAVASTWVRPSPPCRTPWSTLFRVLFSLSSWAGLGSNLVPDVNRLDFFLQMDRGNYLSSDLGGPNSYQASASPAGENYSIGKSLVYLLQFSRKSDFPPLTIKLGIFTP